MRQVELEKQQLERAAAEAGFFLNFFFFFFKFNFFFFYF
jgi:hypothetical protein